MQTYSALLPIPRQDWAAIEAIFRDFSSFDTPTTSNMEIFEVYLYAFDGLS